jgi:hypothetical protein
MYGVERSVVALARPDGVADGKTTLEVKGSVGDDVAGIGNVGVGVGIGVTGVGMEVFTPGRVALLGRSHAVCGSVNHIASSILPNNNAYHVRVNLELHPQHRVRDVVDQVCSAHTTIT